MPRQKKQPSTKEVLSKIASGLRTASVRPNIYGYKPYQPHQYRFHASQARGKLFIGGNRSGKTIAGCTEVIMRAMGRHPFRKVPEPPVRIRACTVDFEYGLNKIMLPEVSRWLPMSEVRGGSWSSGYNGHERTLYLENRGFIEFKSYDQDLEKFAGTSRHYCWFDEEPPQDIYTESMARLVDTAGDWAITMTPVEGATWTFDDIYTEGKTNPNIDIIEVDMADNPFLSQAEIDLFLAGLSEDEKKARVHGKYIHRGGLIYPQFKKEHILEASWEPPKDWLHIAGMDHGYNNPTAWLWAAINPDGKIFIWDEHYEPGQIVRYHAGKVHETNRLHGREPDYYIGDPSIKNVDPLTGTSVHLEYIEHGIPIVLGNNDVKAGINRVARYLQRDNLYITRRCENLLYELPRYRWGTWAHKKMDRDRNRKEDPRKKDDHACDALRYLVASRPEMDDGRDIPESKIPSLASSQSVNPYLQTTDTDLSRLKQQDIDPVMGSYF